MITASCALGIFFWYVTGLHYRRRTNEHAPICVLGTPLPLDSKDRALNLFSKSQLVWAKTRYCSERVRIDLRQGLSEDGSGGIDSFQLGSHERRAYCPSVSRLHR
jgi:hypothetical protein